MKLKKTSLVLLCLILLAGAMPASLAQEAAVLTLGAGAPIPYLTGYTSRLIKDAALLQGITGRVDLRFEQPDARTLSPQFNVSIHIQNISLTEDVLALFFRAEFPDFLPLSYGTAWESYARSVPFLVPLVDGQHLPFLNLYQEGHPDGEKSMLCLVVYTLQDPVSDQALISFKVNFNEKAGGEDRAPQVRVDTSRAQDLTRAVNPQTPLRFQFEISKGHLIDYQFTLCRVSFGPFGNRILIRNRDDGRGIGLLPCVLQDEAGRALTVIPTGFSGSGLASPAKPVDVYNEVLFLGGEGSKTLRLVPFQSYTKEGSQDAPVALPLFRDYPYSLPLSPVSELTIHGLKIDEQGLSIHHSITGPGTVNFQLGDADSQPISKLNNQAVGFIGYDLGRDSLVASLLWSGEYKNQPVSRVTPKDIKQAQTLLIDLSSQRFEDRLVEDLAVTIPLK